MRRSDLDIASEVTGNNQKSQVHAPPSDQLNINASHAHPCADNLEGLKLPNDNLGAYNAAVPDRTEKGLRNTEDVISSMYIENAATEDKELVGRWTETLNILLTFAGLQSAMVTAFVLNLDPGLRPDPVETTNTILRDILHRLDNSTANPSDFQTSHAAPPSVVHVLAWWYASLACSLLAASGALLSKQWVMNYHSRLPWLNSPIKKAQLREARYQGLRRWRFHGVIETLPILLQLSLMLFAGGLVEYLRPAPKLFLIIISFITAGSSFYVFTLLSGVISRSSPFKSPVTTFILSVGCHIASVLLNSLQTLAVLTLFLLEKAFPMYKNGKEYLGVIQALWTKYYMTDFPYMITRMYGDPLGMDDELMWASSVFGWWLGQEDRVPEDRQPTTKEVLKVLETLPASGIDNFTRTETFNIWSWRVVDALENYSTREAPVTTAQIEEVREEANTLCFFMYYSSLATRITLSNMATPKMDEFERFCGALRNAQADSGTSMASLRWTTIAVYLRTQLADWCDMRRSTMATVDRTRYQSEVLRELPLLLARAGMDGCLNDTATVVALAAIALVDDSVPLVHGREELDVPDPLEKIFAAMHRLSLYTLVSQGEPGVHELATLFSLLLKATNLAVGRRSKGTNFGQIWKRTAWKNGQIGEAIVRLMDLGILLRDSNPGGGEKGALIRELEVFILALIPWEDEPDLRGLSALSSPNGLASIINCYAGGCVEQPSSPESLTILNAILGFRYLPPTPPRWFHPHRSLHAAEDGPQRIHLLSALQHNTNLLPRLLLDTSTVSDPAVTQDRAVVSSRRRILSAIVKGRDMFLRSGPEKLMEALRGIADEMERSKSFLTRSPTLEYALDSFDLWAELIEALHGGSPEVNAPQP